MRETQAHKRGTPQGYDSQLADRIKSMLRGGDDGKLPDCLATDTEVQLVSNEIFRGGLGRVGRYWDENLERAVAVKFINQDLDASHEQRFLREIKITSSLDHPGVVPIYSIGESHGQPYYTMRFVSGKTFEEAVRVFHASPNRSLDRANPQFRALLESFKSVCATIGYAHREKQVWHRDLKPQNIMIENGLTVVLDWGLAKRSADVEPDPEYGGDAGQRPGPYHLTNADQYLGSPAYMAPEQALGKADQVDHLTDIYGLGATLFELLTGRPPHQRSPAMGETRIVEPGQGQDPAPLPADSDVRTWLQEIAQGPSPSARKVNPSVPSELDSICRRAMAVNKSDRYQEPQGIIDDIENWLVQSEVTAHQYNQVEKLRRWIRQYAGISAVVCLASLLVAIVSVGSFLSVSNAKKQTDSALNQMRAERIARIDDQLKAFVSASPIQAEVFLRELEAYDGDDVDARIGSLNEQRAQPPTAGRLQLVHLDHHPDRLIALLESTRELEVDEVSLLNSAIRTPGQFQDEAVLRRLWQLTDQPETLLTVAVVLSRLATEDERWIVLAPRVAEHLMSVEQGDIPRWSGLLEPARRWLVPPLRLRYQSGATALADERKWAGLFLYAFFQGAPDSLVELVGDADPVLLSMLVERLKEAPDAALDSIATIVEPAGASGRGNVPGELEQASASLGGLVNDAFFICDALPLPQFESIQRLLRQAGFRPLQVHPFAGPTQRSVSTIWIRDGRRDLVFETGNADQVASLLDEKRKEGWVPDDLSAERVDDQIVYTVVFHQDHNDRSDYQMLVGNRLDDHRAQSIQLRRQAFRQMSYIEVEDAAGTLLVAGIYCRDPGQRNSASKAVLLSDLQDNNLLRVADQVPVQVCLGPRGISGIWHDSRELDSVFVTEADASARAARWRSLSQEGFVPACVTASASHTADPGLQSLSIWQRPKLSESAMANYAMALCHLGHEDWLLRRLKRGPDATLRTLLIHRIVSEGIPPTRVATWLERSGDSGIRAGLIQALGQYPNSAASSANFDQIVKQVQTALASDPDPGVHSSALWALEKWGRLENLLPEQTGFDHSRNWFVDHSGQTMSVVRGPVSFDMGTRIVPGNTAASENFHRRTIPRSFAIATHEVTWDQFAKFSNRMPAGFTRFYSKTVDGLPNGQAPQYQVNWYRAAEYCNWLSQEAGLPESEWCYLPNPNGEFGPELVIPDDFLDRKGYRLPTEAEWEFAARAGTGTSRFFGRDVDMISYYGWYKSNSNISTQSVGQLKPNELGLFDVYGNVWEWCHGSRDDPWPEYFEEAMDRPSNVPPDNRHPRALRGGSMVNSTGLLRSSIRSFNRPSNEQFTIGFRVARTLPGPDEDSNN